MSENEHPEKPAKAKRPATVVAGAVIILLCCAVFGLLLVSFRAPRRDALPKKAARLDDEGWKLLQEGRAVEAVPVLRRALQQAPGNSRILYHLGLACRQAGELAQALEYLKSACESDRTKPEYLTALGGALADRGLCADAVKVLKKSLGMKPDQPDARCCLGSAYVGLGRYQEAVTEFEKALRLDPNMAEALAQLGLAEVAMGDTKSALSHCLEAVKLRPGSPRCRLALARVRRRAGDSDGARKEALQVLKTAPAFAPAYLLLAEIALDEGKPDEAVKRLDEYLERRPGDIAALMCKGNALRDAGKLDKAVEVFREAVRLAPNSLQVHGAYQETMKRLGRNDELVKGYSLRSRSDPNDALGHYLLASALSDPAAAAKEYARAAELSPRSLPVHYALGKTLLRLRRFGAAEEHLRQAEKLDPDSSDIILQLARLYEAQKRYDEALAECDKLLSKRPGDARALLSKARICADMLSYDQARDCVAAIRALSKPEPAKSLALKLITAELLEAEGRFDKAAELCREVAAREKDFPKQAAEAKFRNAMLTAETGRLPQAVGLLDELLSKKAEGLGGDVTASMHADILFWKGVISAMQGKNAAARASWNKLRDWFKGRPPYRGTIPLWKASEFLLGKLSQKDFQAFADTFAFLWDNDAAFFIGLRFRMLGDAEQAKRFYKKCLDVSWGKEFPYWLAHLMLQPKSGG